ncbi:hypothetical protein J6590_000673 [Homalodisca vitripennis]|nr:hypothetical protein J6590_000673 [Homalodisca vitripennis]
MEILPEEMLEAIGRYLTVRDLLACSAVNRKWREALNQDSVWRTHCHQNAEEHIRLTPQKLEPNFVIPLNADVDLSPICKWRQAYMREVHIRRNWRRGRFHQRRLVDQSNSMYPPVYTDDGEDEDNNPFKTKFHVDFFTNDIMVVLTEVSIELWSLQSDPIVNLSKLLHHVPTHVFSGFRRIETDNPGMVLVHYNGVQVFFMDPISNSLTLQHMFYFDEEIKLPRMTCDVIKQMFIYDQYTWRYSEYFVVDSLFLGITKYKETKLHVWDLEGGVKVREEDCPVNVEYNIIDLKASRTDGDVLVVFAQLDDSPANEKRLGVCGIRFTAGFYHFFVYSTKRLRFLPYHHSRWIRVGYASTIQKPYIAVCDHEKIDLYNYLSSERVNTFWFRLEHANCLGVTERSIVCLHEKTLRAFITTNRTVVETKGNVQMFSVIHGNFVDITTARQNGIWEIGETAIIRTGISLPRGCTQVVANTAGTKLLVRQLSNEKTLLLMLNFW